MHQAAIPALYVAATGTTPSAHYLPHWLNKLHPFRANIFRRHQLVNRQASFFATYLTRCALLPSERAREKGRGEGGREGGRERTNSAIRPLLRGIIVNRTYCTVNTKHTHTHFPVSTSNIRSCLLWSPVIVACTWYVHIMKLNSVNRPLLRGTMVNRTEYY